MSSSDSTIKAQGDTLMDDDTLTNINYELVNKCDVKRVEREVQHFGFTPKALSDTIYNRLISTYEDMTPSIIKEHLLIMGKSEQESEEKSKLISEDFKQTFAHKAEEKCDLLEVCYTCDVFDVPKNIPLEGDAPRHYTETEERKVIKKYEKLKLQVREEKYRSHLYKKELKKTEKAIAEMKNKIKAKNDLLKKIEAINLDSVDT